MQPSCRIKMWSTLFQSRKKDFSVFSVVFLSTYHSMFYFPLNAGLRGYWNTHGVNADLHRCVGPPPCDAVPTVTPRPPPCRGQQGSVGGDGGGAGSGEPSRGRRRRRRLAWADRPSSGAPLSHPTSLTKHKFKDKDC